MIRINKYDKKIKNFLFTLSSITISSSYVEFMSTKKVNEFYPVLHLSEVSRRLAASDVTISCKSGCPGVKKIIYKRLHSLHLSFYFYCDDEK